MKKFLCCICFIIVLLALFAYNNNVLADVVTFGSGDIAVYQQLDSLRVKTSKGKLLSEMQTESSIQKGSMQERVDICFILDVSGSMNGTRINTLKTATIELINQIGDLFEDKSKLRISLIKFSTDVERVTNNPNFIESTQMIDIENAINSLGAFGSTNTYDAIIEAQKLWEENASNKAEHTYTILITDGEPSQNTKIREANGQLCTKYNAIQYVIDNFKDNLPDNKLLTIICGNVNKEITEGTHKYTIEELFSHSDEVISRDDSGFFNAITSGILNFITSNYIDLNSFKTNITNLYNCKPIPNKGFESEIDDELINGAILELEYSFNIIANKEIKEINIKDYMPKGVAFDEASVLLTQNTTNKSNGWKLLGNNPIITLYPNNVRSDGTYDNVVIKILLTKVLSIDMDVSEIINNADIKITTMEFDHWENIYDTDGKLIDRIPVKIERTYETSSSDSIPSPEYDIIPPPGANNYMPVLVFCVLILVIELIAIVYSFKLQNAN